MTLCVGDELSKTRSNEIITGEAHRRFEVVKTDYNGDGTLSVTLKVLE